MLAECVPTPNPRLRSAIDAICTLTVHMLKGLHQDHEFPLNWGQTPISRAVFDFLAGVLPAALAGKPATAQSMEA